jgi:SAM-dependent methyltransferase
VLERLNLRPGERALELGCGGGHYTHEAARFVGPTGRVCAIDISPRPGCGGAGSLCRTRLGRMPRGGYCSAAIHCGP